MAMRSRPTALKRQRERERLEKQKMKAARRAEKSQRETRSRAPSGVDPDIAHIVPGPQPPADWQVDEVEDESNDEEDSDRS